MPLLRRNEIILLLCSLAAVILALPYPYKLLSVLAGILIIAGLVLSGFLMARKIGLPVFGLKRNMTVGDALKPIIVGLVVGLFIIIVMKYLIAPIEPKILERFKRDTRLPLWQWLIIVIHAPILEEVVFRLFCLTLIALLITMVAKEKSLTNRRLWIANIISALIFAAAHLPPWIRETKISGMLLITVLLINLCAALIFGYYYIRRGIQFAILAHFGADIAVHMIPLFIFSAST
jgi:membrane protease YdiL (CAAX protease family)